MAERLQRFLASVSDPLRRPIRARDVAVVVAHPDDEAIGCGALLRRLDGVSVIVVSDGAPRNLGDARALGFGTAADYAAARHRELVDATMLCGIGGDQLIALAIPDQETAWRIAGLANSLAAIFLARGTAVVLTHAYEGGHPDHDATALAVSIAARLNDSAPLTVVEMPFYRLGPQGMLMQSFAPDPDSPETAVALSAAERGFKRQMLAAYVTQRRTLAPFGVDIERFRPAPNHNFLSLPNGGNLLYEHNDWGMTGGLWLELAQAALGECGLLAVPACL